jgi:FPC/CPF motif-containing protein YcgG
MQNHDPRHSFQRIIDLSQCAFAPRAKHDCLPPFPSDRPIADHIRSIRDELVQFVTSSRETRFDGFVCEFPDPKFGDTLDNLKRTVREVLNALSDQDPAGRHSMREDITKPEWFFSFAGERLYLVTFAPCYPADSSRRTLGDPTTYLVFQLHHSFERARPEGGEEIVPKIKEVIRARHSAAGCPYDVAISLDPREAYRFVKPLKLGEPSVEWWHD